MENLEAELKKYRVSIAEVARALNLSRPAIYYNLRHPDRTLNRVRIEGYLAMVKAKLKQG